MTLRLLTAAACLVAATSLPALSCNRPANEDAILAAMLTSANAERARAGLPKLHVNKRLQSAALGHACDMAGRNKMTHASSDGRDLRARVKGTGYKMRLAAENVGQGFRSGESAVKWWMTSPGHRKNILQKTARDIGVAVALSADGTLYWEMVVAQPK